MALPSHHEGPSTWVGTEIQDDPSWVLHFDDAMITELDDGLARAERDGLTVPFDPSSFPLQRCGALIDQALALLDDGPGLALVRGLPRERYTDEQCELLYWAFATHIGTPISQNSMGHLIGHVRDTGQSFEKTNVRAYQTNAKLDYHADQIPVEVLGLFCLRTAMHGGESKIVSATTIHNTIRDERPDLLQVLYEPYHLDWRDEQPEGEPGWYTQPLYSVADGKLCSRFTSLAYFRTVDRFGAELAMSNEQVDALEFVQEVANRPGMALSMDFQEGDMQFLNNHVMLHAREGFEDHADPALRRHLLRLWVGYPPERRRPLSDQLAGRYRWVEMGGIPARPPA